MLVPREPPVAGIWLEELVRQVEERARRGDRIAELVLELGDLEQPTQRPLGMRRGRRGYCFANAGRRACPGAGEQRYLYVEGFAFLNSVAIPIHHAWISEGEGAIEVTWPEPGLAYMGIRFGCHAWATLYTAYGQDDLLESLSLTGK